MALTDTLSEGLQAIASLAPRLAVVHSYQRAVRFRRGQDPAEVGPGVVWYWPLVTELAHVSVARRTSRVQGFRLRTSDKVTVVCSAVIVYRVTDPVTWQADNEDPEEGVVEVLEAAVMRVVKVHSLEDLESDGEPGAVLTPADKALAKRARAELEATFGIKVERCRLCDLAPARVLALDHTGMKSTTSDEEGE